MHIRQPLPCIFRESGEEAASMMLAAGTRVAYRDTLVRETRAPHDMSLPPPADAIVRFYRMTEHGCTVRDGLYECSAEKWSFAFAWPQGPAGSDAEVARLEAECAADRDDHDHEPAPAPTEPEPEPDYSDLPDTADDDAYWTGGRIGPVLTPTAPLPEAHAPRKPTPAPAAPLGQLGLFGASPIVDRQPEPRPMQPALVPASARTNADEGNRADAPKARMARLHSLKAQRDALQARGRATADLDTLIDSLNASIINSFKETPA